MSERGGPDAVWYRCRWLLPVCGPAIDGAVFSVVDGRFGAVGGFLPDSSPEAVDLGEVVVVPGLINLHCHLDFTGMRGAILPPKSFPSWIRRINEMKRIFTPDDYVRAIREGAAEVLASGTTTLLNIESFPELVVQAIAGEQGILPDIIWCAELIDVRPGRKASTILSQAIEPLEMCGVEAGVSPHAPYTASRELFAAARDESLRSGRVFTTHLSESAEEGEMFYEGRGELHALISSLGTQRRAGCSPLEAVSDLLPAGSILAHMNFASASDIGDLRRGHHTIVHCPRSHSYFGRPPFPLEMYRDAGVPVCLGTDSLASNQSLDLLSEMRQFASQFPATPKREILEMVTSTAARAIKREGQIGRISPGTQAHFLTMPSISGDPYASVFAEGGRPDAVYLRGRKVV